MYDFILFFKYFYTFLCTHFDFNYFNLSSCKYFLKITALSLCTTLKKTHFIAWNCYLWSIRVHKLFFSSWTAAVLFLICSDRSRFLCCSFGMWDKSLCSSIDMDLEDIFSIVLEDKIQHWRANCALTKLSILCHDHCGNRKSSMALGLLLITCFFSQ